MDNKADHTRAESDARAAADTKGAAPRRAPAKVTEQTTGFDLLRCAMYHDMRENSLARIGRWFLWVTILLGTSSVAAFSTAYPIIGQASGVLVAVVSSLSLVFDFSGQARDHRDLKRRFFDLLAKYQGDGDEAAARSQMTKIFADEPPVKQSVNRTAHNRAGESLYGEDFTRA